MGVAMDLALRLQLACSFRILCVWL